MAAKMLFVLLGAVCSLHSLNAWPWDETTAAPSAANGEDLLAQVAAVRKQVEQAVKDTHAAVEAANVDEAEASALARAGKAVDDLVLSWARQVQSAAEATRGRDTSACIARFEEDLAKATVETNDLVKQDINSLAQEVRTTPAEADALLEQYDALEKRAQEEAAKPAAEFGAEVRSILFRADSISRKASYNNVYIASTLENLNSSVGIALVSPGSRKGLAVAGTDALSCIRRLRFRF